MADYLLDMALSVILATVDVCFSNPTKKASVKRKLIKVRDKLNQLYPEGE